MATVHSDAPGASEGGNLAPGIPNVNGAKLRYLVF